MVKLELFDIRNSSHLNLIKELNNDELVNEHVKTICLINNMTYVIKNNDLLVGILKINKELNNYYSIDRAILKPYRNKGYGTESLKEALNLLEEYDTVLMRTSYDNEASIESIKKAGFKLDYEQIEKCEEEGSDYIVFSKKNPNYKKIKTKINI